MSGIANADSIAWACAQAFHAQGAHLIVTYENEDKRRAVEALAGEIGDVAAFLVLEKASGINGQVIHVDNGFTTAGWSEIELFNKGDDLDPDQNPWRGAVRSCRLHSSTNAKDFPYARD